MTALIQGVTPVLSPAPAREVGSNARGKSGQTRWCWYAGSDEIRSARRGWSARDQGRALPSRWTAGRPHSPMGQWSVPV